VQTILAHRQDARRNAEPAAEVVGDFRQALARSEATGALDMRGKVAVTELEPGRAAERLERRHKGPGLVAPAPTELQIVDASEGIEEGIDIGRNGQAEMFEIVAGIGDDG